MGKKLRRLAFSSTRPIASNARDMPHDFIYRQSFLVVELRQGSALYSKKAISARKINGVSHRSRLLVSHGVVASLLFQSLSLPLLLLVMLIVLRFRVWHLSLHFSFCTRTLIRCCLLYLHVNTKWVIELYILIPGHLVRSFLDETQPSPWKL